MWQRPSRRHFHVLSVLNTQADPSLSRRSIPTNLNAQHKGQIANKLTPLNYDQQHDKEVEEIRALGMNRNSREALKISTQLSKEESDKRSQHLVKVRKNLDNYPTTLAEFQKSLHKPQTEMTEDQLKQERRIQDIHEYFGYWIDPSDPRFDFMLKQKAAEEARAEKLAKKEEKKKRTIASTS